MSPLCSSSRSHLRRAGAPLATASRTSSGHSNISMDGGREITEQDRVLYALCRPDRLLDLARRFTLFDLGVKKVARYQQFFAVKNILHA